LNVECGSEKSKEVAAKSLVRQLSTLDLPRSNLESRLLTGALVLVVKFTLSIVNNADTAEERRETEKCPRTIIVARRARRNSQS